jgi:hypothetical protein
MSATIKLRHYPSVDRFWDAASVSGDAKRVLAVEYYQSPIKGT